MRHATDPDHVVAVTTIVSDERSLWRASAVGAVWGVGHSITILAVGGAIVVFRLVIPPRLGLLLEFCVAVMLILLGMLTLSGRRVGSATNMARPLVVGIVHGLAGFGVRRAPRSRRGARGDAPAPLPGAVRGRHHRRNGGDHDGGRASVGGDGAPVRPRAALSAGGERVGQSRLRRRARSARRLTTDCSERCRTGRRNDGGAPPRAGNSVGGCGVGTRATRATCRGAGRAIRTKFSSRS